VVFVNHYPLHRAPTLWLRHPEFAPWCGTERTADWHVRYRAVAVVYGHLHIRRTSWQDGVRFEEVSMGYPAQWRPRGCAPGPRVVLPAAATGSAPAAAESGRRRRFDPALPGIAQGTGDTGSGADREGREYPRLIQER
jgi:hypothetical protein